MSAVDQLPRPYQLLAQLAALTSGPDLEGVGGPGDDIRAIVQDLAMELWKAGQTEKRAMDSYEYDPPLWARGMFIEEVARAVGVPTVAASDPARDLGRGASTTKYRKV